MINNKFGEWAFEIFNRETVEIFRRRYNQIKRYVKPLESGANSNSTKLPIQRNGRLEGPDVTDVDEFTDRLDEGVRRSARTRRPTVRYGYDTAS